LEAASAIAGSAVEMIAANDFDSDSQNDSSVDVLDDCFQEIFHCVLSRSAAGVEIDAMRETFQKSYIHYINAPDDALSLVGIGQSKPDAPRSESPLNAARCAALMVVASMVINLDEAITHE